MVALADVLTRFERWTDEYEQGKIPVLDRKLVHKHQKENVLVSRIERVNDEHPDDHIGQLYLDPKHPFFFEHPLNHYPGLMLVEAGRQMGTAIAHLSYDVPFDHVFILDSVTVSFEQFAELDIPVFVNSELREKKFKRGRLTGMHSEGHFIQNGQSLGLMSGRWSIFDKRVIARLHRSSMRARGQLQDA